MSSTINPADYLAAPDYVYPAKVSWLDVLNDLKIAGIGAARVALLLGAESSTVRQWRVGHEPRHSYGQALLALHRRYCSPEATKKRQLEATVTL